MFKISKCNGRGSDSSSKYINWKRGMKLCRAKFCFEAIDFENTRELDSKNALALEHSSLYRGNKNVFSVAVCGARFYF